MLGLGWTEMMVLGVVALIVIGPKDLPVVMNRIGKVAGQIRRMGSDFQRELNKTTGLDEVRNLRNSIAAPLKQTSDEIRKEFNTMTAAGPKPSGVIKPADPNAESVVDEIKAAAGMAPAKAAPKATPKTADQIAAESGFKRSVPAPVSSKADTPGAPRKRAPRKSPVKAAAAPGRPAVATKPKTPEAVPDPAEQKPVPEPARKPRTPKVTEQPDVPALPNEPADSPATKTPRVRAPRKTKPAKAGKE